MKKLASLALVIVALFSCIVFSACGDKYKKMEMTFCSSTGSEIEELVLIKDEINDNGYDEKRIGVKFSGVKEKYIGQILVYSYPENVVNVDNYVYDGDNCYFDVKAAKSSITDETKLIVKHLTTDKTESIKLRVEEKSYSLNVSNKKYVVAVNRPQTHILKTKELVSLIPSSSTDKVYFKLKSGVLPEGIKLVEEELKGQKYITGFTVEEGYDETKNSKFIGSIVLHPVTYLDGYEFDESKYESKEITIHFDTILEGLTINVEDRYKDSETGELLGGSKENPIQLVVNNLSGDEAYNEILLFPDLQILDNGDETTLETTNVEKYLEDYLFIVEAPDCLTWTDLGSGNVLVNAGFSPSPVSVTLTLKPEFFGDAQTVFKEFWIQPVVRADSISVTKQGGNGVEELQNEQVVDIYTDYLNNNGIVFKFDAYSDSDLIVSKEFDYCRIEIAPEILYTELTDGVYDNIYVSENEKYNGVNLQTYIQISNQRNLISIIKGNQLLKFYIEEDKLISEPISSTDEIYIKCVKTNNSNGIVKLEFNVLTNYEGDLAYLKNLQNAEMKLMFEAHETIGEMNLFAAEEISDGYYEIFKDAGESIPVKEIYLDVSSTKVFKLVISQNNIKSVTGSEMKSEIKLKYSITSEKPVENPFLLHEKSTDYVLINGANDVRLDLVADGKSIGKYVVTFVQGEGDNGFKKEIIVYAYKSFSGTQIEEFKIEGLNDSSFLAETDFKTTYGLSQKVDYVAKSNSSLTLETIINKDVVSSGIISGFNYDFSIVNASGSEDKSNVKYKFFEYKPFTEGNKTELLFYNGTIIENEKYYVRYNININYQTYENILKKGEVKPYNTQKYFYIYDSISEYNGISLNKPYLTKYMDGEDYLDYNLGYYYKSDSEETLEIQMKDSYFWNYIDTIYDVEYPNKKVEWSVTVEDPNYKDLIELTQTGYKYITKCESVDAKFLYTDSSMYKCKIVATLYQFGKPYVLQSEVLVKKTILTNQLHSTTPELEFEGVKSGIYQYTVNLQLNDELLITAEHLNSDGEVNHKELKFVMVDYNGNKAQNIAEIYQDENKIKIKQVQAGYKLIVYSKDRLQTSIESLTKDFENTSLFIGKNPVYFVINLHLEDGETPETAYSVYNVNDFEKMISDNVAGKSIGKYYRIMNSINLSSMKSEYFNKDFNAHIFGVDDDIVLYDLKLNDENVNLFSKYDGSIENLKFEVEYAYESCTDNYLGVIGELKEHAVLKDVGVILSNAGDKVTISSTSSIFGGLIAVNKSKDITFTEYFVAVKGNISISGFGGGIFGGYVGQNEGILQGSNVNESTIETGTVIPVFSSYESGSGATSELNLTVNKLDSVGGIIGYNYESGCISGVFAYGVFNVSDCVNVGGVIGKNVWNSVGGWTRTEAKVEKINTTFNSHLKSNVKISGGTNVGGIVGYDKYGNYDYCWYQVLPNETDSVLKGSNVGGIIGYSVASKIYFSSAMSYRWDYMNLWNIDEQVSIFNEKQPDILATYYAGGLVGLTAATSTEISAETDMKDYLVIQYSSVNAYVSAVTDEVGGLYSTNAKQSDGTVVDFQFVPVYHSYFIGKLSQPQNNESLCFTNRKTSLKTDNSSYSINVEEGKDLYLVGDYQTVRENWKKYEGLNGDYIYVSSSNSENKPIFEIVPNDLKVYKKGGEETDTEIVLNYYDFNAMGYTVDQVRQYNKEYNTYNLVNLFDFKSSTAGTMRIYVKSSNNNVISISGGSLIVNSAVENNQLITITFSPVLNPNFSTEVKIKVEVPLSGIEIYSNGVKNISSLSIAVDTTQKLIVKSIGVTNDVYGRKYKSKEDFGLFVTIKSPIELGSNISTYVEIGGTNYHYDSNTISKIFIPFGTTFSIKVNKYCETPFTVEVYPAMSESDLTYASISKEFTLNTFKGATDISLSYDSAIIYPNDITTIKASVTTDIKIEDETQVKNILMGGYLKIGSNAENSILQVDIQKVIELVSFDEYDDVNHIQTVIFKLNLSKFKDLDAQYHLSDEDVSLLSVYFKTAMSKQKTISFEILPQRIDKIDLSSYIYVGTYSESDLDNKIELLDVLKPNKVGLAIINVSPLNAYYEYLEISDVTGNEEIKFIQVNGVYGTQIETFEQSKDGKGIKLNLTTEKTLYVLMQIDKDYTSKPHTLQISAYYKNELLRTDYKTIEVKMLPSIKVDYQLPNSDHKYFETDSSGSANIETQYFANGTEAMFRITTANVTEPMKKPQILDDEIGEYISHNFTFENLYDDFYVLKCVNSTDTNLGENVIIRLRAEANVNGTTDEAIMDIKFQIVNYVIHSISTTHTIDNESRTEIYGNLYNKINLEYYFKPTDISFNYNGGYNDLAYTYDENLTSTNESLNSINNILKVLNAKVDNGSVDYNLDGSTDDTFTFVTLNKGLNTSVVSTGSRLQKKYNVDGINQKRLVEITYDKENGSSIYVKEGYDKSLKYAIDFELQLDQNGDGTNDWNWSILTDNDVGTMNVSKNYDLSFVQSSSQQDYLLIKDENDFINIASGEKNYYILGNDLVLEDYSPMDINVAEFDGNGHTITIKSFAKFTETEIKAGLFKSIPENMMVRNLNVVYKSTPFETVYSFGSVAVSSQNSSDGVINFENEYADLCNDETINYTKATFAGITPENNGVITNCTVSGRVALRASSVEFNSSGANEQYSTNFDISGLVGTNTKTGYITNCVSEMQIFALANIGGFVNKNEGKIASCEVKGKVVIYAYNTTVSQTIVAKVAGFVVENTGEISMSDNTMIYSGLRDSYQGIMSAKDISSGFVYKNTGKISNCFVEISKIGNNNNTFTGFVYENSGTISTSYTLINQGVQSKSNNNMFAIKNTQGLDNCLEFVYFETLNDQTLYKQSFSSPNLTTYAYVKNTINQAVFQNHNFVFGDGKSAVWTMDRSRELPSLVSCLEKISVNTTLNTGEYYYGIRDFTYKPISINNPDGTVSYKMQVEFVNVTYGSKDNPYIIRNLEEFDSTGKLAGGWNYYFTNGTTAYYRIVKDIVFSSIGNPLTSTYEFKGNIQGNDMLLSNIKLYVPDTQAIESVGLFAKLVSAEDIAVENSIRNLKIKTTSIWASKGNAVGSLAGKSIGFNLYNISISTGKDNIVGGNAVGGLVGYVGGKFDIDGISSSVSVTSTMEILTNTYSIFTSMNNENNKTSNLSSVYYAGSVVGILDAYDTLVFNVHNDRKITEKYYKVKHISVTGSIVNVGTIVGGAFGFVGERVFVENVLVDITSSMFKGREYSACIAGENRGVISEFKVFVDAGQDENVQNSETFKNATHVVAGVVGFNVGGLVQNGSASVDIVKGTSETVVGGIIGRNVGGTVNNVSFEGKIIGMVTGVIIGTDYTRETIISHTTGTSVMSRTCRINTNLIPNSYIKYLSSTEIKMENLVVEQKTLNYYAKNVNLIYSLETSNDQTKDPLTIFKNNYYAFGLLVGYTDIVTDSTYGNSTSSNFDLSKVEVTYSNDKLTMNVSSTGVDAGYKDYTLNDGQFTFTDTLSNHRFKDESLGITEDGWWLYTDDGNGTEENGEFSRQYPLRCIGVSNLSSACIGFIVGARVENNNFDSWDKSKGFSKNFVVLANI